MSARPDRLLVVLGTATEVGKTWVGCRLLEARRAAGDRVAARKPAQSWDPAERAAGARTDAELLAAATGEDPSAVCPAHRDHGVALAPPMAAARLGLPPIHLRDLVAELTWPAGVDLGLVEAAGGVRSPLAEDGDGRDLVRALAPDVVVLVADAGLGTIHAVRSSLEGLGAPRVIVHLNRYAAADPLHRENAAWLAERDGQVVTTTIGGLAAAVAGGT